MAFTSAAASLAPQFSFAQQQPEQAAADGTPWELGLGVASTQRPYAGAGSKTIPFPEVSYENQYLRIDGTSIDAKLGATGPWSLSLRATYALADGYKAGDAPILYGMSTRDASLWLGPTLHWNTEVGRLSFELLGDSLGKSKGMQAKFGVEHDFQFGAFTLTPHLGAQFVDKNYVDYYYGVTAAEATALRPAYGGKSTVNLEAGLRTVFRIDATSSIFVDIDAKALGAGITDSPLVDRKVIPTLVAGYAYRF